MLSLIELTHIIIYKLPLELIEPLNPQGRVFKVHLFNLLSRDFEAFLTLQNLLLGGEAAENGFAVSHVMLGIWGHESDFNRVPGGKEREVLVLDSMPARCYFLDKNMRADDT